MLFILIKEAWIVLDIFCYFREQEEKTAVNHQVPAITR